MNEGILPIQLSRLAWDRLTKHLDQYPESVPVRGEIRRQLEIIDSLGDDARFEVVGKQIIRAYGE